MGGEPGSGSIVVLHVDDDPAFADLTADFLEEHGRFDVVTATSAADGLAVIADGAVECVVSDFDMPDRNGIEFLEAVREADPDLPFILFTGKGSEEVASEAISAGVTDYLQKEPGLAQYEVLANRIENAVERHRAQRQVAIQRNQYQRLFEDAPVMYAIARDEDGEPIIETCNRWFLERLGYDREAVVGRPFSSFYTEDSKTELLGGGGYDRALEGRFTTEERSFVTADGEILETMLRAVPRFDEDGDLVGTLTLYVERSDHPPETDGSDSTDR